MLLIDTIYHNVILLLVRVVTPSNLNKQMWDQDLYQEKMSINLQIDAHKFTNNINK